MVHLHIELLDEFGVTSAENSSSAVCLLHFDGNKYLFTGDSGVESLKKVIEYANNNGIDLTNLYFLQVPHHGSKRNVSPIILNAIKGEVAYVSASKDAPKHPSKKVLNALKKRGTRVYSTEGTNLISVHNRPMRPGYSTINPHVFYDKVEE